MKPLLATALAFAMLLFPLGSGVLHAAEDTGPKAYEAAEALRARMLLKSPVANL